MAGCFSLGEGIHVGMTYKTNRKGMQTAAQARRRVHPAGNVRKERNWWDRTCGEAAAGLEKCWAELISRDTDKGTLNSVLSTGTKAPLAISGHQTGELPVCVR